MVVKKIDNRIRVLIENGVAMGHRSLFVVVGDKGRDQVVILHHILSKATFKARPSVLWCYKKELGFSSHRKKRMRQLQKKIHSGKLNVREDDPFELFVASTQIRYCYYAETHKILGNTFGMCVLQDFEALTPNLLARTIETVDGGGLVVVLLRSMTSLRQLCTMTMDVHARYRTEAQQDVVARFNERFLLSLSSCRSCVVVDDSLNVLPLSAHLADLKPVPAHTKDQLSTNDADLAKLKPSLQDTQPLGALVGCCRTLDQAKAVLQFIDVITEKTLRSTVALTAARGRGKSAALGIAIAGAVAFGYSNIFVTSPTPENLKTLFEFIMKGFDALEYQEHIDYELIESTNPDFNKAVIRVNVFRDHRQTIQYVHPTDAVKLGQAELVVIDEAAAIPIPLVKSLLGPYLVFLSSTVNGYEGTGRSLSLKLIQQLREQSASFSGDKKALTSATGRTLQELTLEESIRYKPGDEVEAWLNRLLCLDVANVPKLVIGCPSPSECELYYVNRDTLFSYHAATEKFLQRMMSIYVAAHYKNTPNDLQMISDAPAHHIFCLLGPQSVQKAKSELPDILCVLQVCLEGGISKSSVQHSLSRGQRAAGDLIPWTIAQQFQDNDFASLSGARIVRIATHPDYQGMGYGCRALEQLQQYFEGGMLSLEDGDIASHEETVTSPQVEDTTLLEETITPRQKLPPLFLRLSERKPEKLDYLGVSYGLTNTLLKFWKRGGYVPVYLRQTPNDLTGEHSCIMLKLLHADELSSSGVGNWLLAYHEDFCRRMINLLAYQFASFPPALALAILLHKEYKSHPSDGMSREELAAHLTNTDLRRLELYAQNLVDYHLITDLLPTLARLYFLRKVDTQLTVMQMAILVGLGLQHKTIDQLVKDLDVQSSQLLALFNKTIRKLLQVLNAICEQAIETQLTMGPQRHKVVMEPSKKSLQEDLEEAALEIAANHETEKLRLKDMDVAKFAIRGSEDDWAKALEERSAQPNTVSVKRRHSEKPKVSIPEAAELNKSTKKKRRKHHSKH